MALHALLNVSTESANRLPICKAALKPLLAQSRDHAAPATHTNFVLGVLTNISKDSECKKLMVRSVCVCDTFARAFCALRELVSLRLSR